MILKKMIVDGKEVYIPISKEKALESDNKKDLIFTDEDEQDEFEELLDELEDEKRNGEEDDSISFNSTKSKKSNRIITMLPFLDDDELHELVEDIISDGEKYKGLSLAAVMPFLDDSDCDKIFLKAINNENQLKHIGSLAPFVSEGCLSELVECYINGDYPELNLDVLYPFMSTRDIKRLFKYFIAKRELK